MSGCDARATRIPVVGLTPVQQIEQGIEREVQSIESGVQTLEMDVAQLCRRYGCRLIFFIGVGGFATLGILSLAGCFDQRGCFQ